MHWIVISQSCHPVSERTDTFMKLALKIEEAESCKAAETHLSVLKGRIIRDHLSC